MASFLDSVFGSKPQVAPYTPTDLPTEQLNSILANQAAFPDIQALGSMYETYMLDSFNTAIPGFSDILAGGGQMTKQMEDQASSFLKGELPQDVIDNIRRTDALTSILSGGPGGSAALTRRDLGTTSIGLINEGAQLAGEAGNAAQRWAGLASGMIMSPSGMMITPQQQAAMTMQNNLYKQATQQLQYNVNAAPNPALQAANQWIEQVGGSVLASYAGGGMGGMGGGKGGSFETSWQNPASSGGSQGSAPPAASPAFGSMGGFAPPPSVAASSGNIFNPSFDPYLMGGSYG